jgi:8-amino-7-oxononanoate synthase
MIEPESLPAVDRTRVLFRRRKLVGFSGCDYFRLASHPAVLQAVRDGLEQFGLNVAASRLTTGNHALYGELELQLAGFFGAEDALLVPCGYVAALAAAQALAGTFSHALVDERAHPALWEAAAALDCPARKFKHRDPDDLARALARCGRSARPVILTDGMFSQDGSTAPLLAYLRILPRAGLMLVDDAHGAGVLGRTGRGTLEAEGVGRGRIVQCVTLSKAFGVYGGAVLGTRRLRQAILARSRLFVGSTPLPLPLASAALAAVKILKRDRRLRRRLIQNATRVKAGLRKAGLAIPDVPGPIIAIHPRTERAAGELKRRLLAAGIYPPFLKYPGGPARGFFRFAVSSEHTAAQLNALIAVLSRP